MADERVVRVGIIGGGQFMSRQHIQTVHRNSRLRLHHLCELNKERLSELSQTYCPARQTLDWKDVLEDPEVDVVVVGVLPALHPEIARAAIESQKPIYVEKPLTETIEQGLEIQKLSREKNVPVAVGFNRRFAPATEILKQAFDSVAPPYSLFYRISDDDRVRPPAQSWKLECRLLIELVHIFDLVSYLFDAEPVRIFAGESRFNDSQVFLDFDNGSIASLFSSSWGTMEQPKEHLEAILDRSAIEMDDFVEVRSFGIPSIPRISRFPGRPYEGVDNSHVDDFAQRGREALIDLRKQYNDAMVESGVLEDSSRKEAWDQASELLGDPPPPQINYAPDKGWGRALEDFCDAVVSGKAPRNATAADGNRATACALAGRRSIEERKPIGLNRAEWHP